jgi:hypothetical protein
MSNNLASDAPHWRINIFTWRRGQKKKEIKGHFLICWWTDAIHGSSQAKHMELRKYHYFLHTDHAHTHTHATDELPSSFLMMQKLFPSCLRSWISPPPWTPKLHLTLQKITWSTTGCKKCSSTLICTKMSRSSESDADDWKDCVYVNTLYWRPSYPCISIKPGFISSKYDNLNLIKKNMSRWPYLQAGRQNPNYVSCKDWREQNWWKA